MPSVNSKYLDTLGINLKDFLKVISNEEEPIFKKVCKERLVIYKITSQPQCFYISLTWQDVNLIYPSHTHFFIYIRSITT